MQSLPSFLVTDIGQLCTNKPIVINKKYRGLQRSDLGIVENAWLAVDNLGRIMRTGENEIPTAWSHVRQISAQNKLVLPGLIDSHTHPIFGGNRAAEFAARLDGKTYQEIAAKGGGIKASIQSSRDASDQQLYEQTSCHLQKFLQYGVTTVETKTGYGQSIAEEIRQLRILNKLQKNCDQHLVITCLALHAIPPEYTSARSYAQDCANLLIPVISEEKLASFIDMFIEQGYFSVEDCEEMVARAKELGLGIRVHADEFSDAKAALAAARWGAASADHLQFASLFSLQQMAKCEVVATLLPGTSVYTAIPFTSGSRIREAGCPIAIASDFNPGSCYIANLPMLAAIAGLHCKLNCAEIIAAITIIAAKSLLLDSQKGALCSGFDADFLITPFESIDLWLADFGQTKPTSVWIKGKKVLEDI